MGMLWYDLISKEREDLHNGFQEQVSRKSLQGIEIRTILLE